MRQLSGLAHEYTTMGVLGPIQLIGRRRVEYPLVQDTVTLQSSKSAPALHWVGLLIFWIMNFVFGKSHPHVRRHLLQLCTAIEVQVEM